MTDRQFRQVGQSVDNFFEKAQIGQGLDKIHPVKSLSTFLTAVGATSDEADDGY